MTTQKLMMERFLFLQEAVAAFSALTTAHKLGVLAQLDRGPVSPNDIAHNCGIGKHGAGLLLSALAGLGLIKVGEDKLYRAIVPHLSRLSILLSLWANLDDVLRHDRPVVDAGNPEGADEFYPEVVPFLGSLFSPVAERAADYLSTPGLRVLDMGAGAAPWSLAIAKRDPSCRVIAVDLPGILPSTRRAVTVASCDGQFEYIGGDIFTLDFGRSAYDLVILGNICHLFDEEANKRLLGRLFETLTPKGTLAILDHIPNEQLDGPRGVVLYSLGLLLRTSQGQAYPFSTYTRWLSNEGYNAIQRFELLSEAPISLIKAQRA
jgi:SAM-dependent methyltransferase